MPSDTVLQLVLPYLIENDRARLGRVNYYLGVWFGGLEWFARTAEDYLTLIEAEFHATRARRRGIHYSSWATELESDDSAVDDDPHPLYDD